MIKFGDAAQTVRRKVEPRYQQKLSQASERPGDLHLHQTSRESGAILHLLWDGGGGALNTVAYVELT